MPQEILILEKASGRFIPAVFHEEVNRSQLIEAEGQWSPSRMAAKQRLLDAGKSEQEIAHHLLQHAHWDWALKSRCLEGDPLALRCYGIELDGEWQGLAIIDLSMHVAQLEPDKGRPLVYVEFLESAPWNLKDMVETPRFGLIGVRLVEAAVRISVAEGFKGRLGLYSLSKAERFYRKCGMVCVKGMEHRGMNLFEFTKTAASAFLEGGCHVNKNEQ